MPLGISRGVVILEVIAVKIEVSLVIAALLGAVALQLVALSEKKLLELDAIAARASQACLPLSVPCADAGHAPPPREVLPEGV